jgi:large subunit ribosomal protein L30
LKTLRGCAANLSTKYFEWRIFTVLRITLIKSTNRAKQKQYATVEALGLNKIRSVVEHNDTPQIRGMIKKVSHLIKVEEI